MGGAAQQLPVLPALSTKGKVEAQGTAIRYLGHGPH